MSGKLESLKELWLQDVAELKVQTDLKMWAKQEEVGMLAVLVAVKQSSGATSALALNCC